MKPRLSKVLPCSTDRLCVNFFAYELKHSSQYPKNVRSKSSLLKYQIKHLFS